MFNELYQQLEEYPYGYYTCRCFEIDNYMINYSRVIDMLQHYYNYINYTENVADDIDENIQFSEFMNMDYKCHICYDTQNDENVIVTLHCNHTFHKTCLNTHITTNYKLCSMCRSELTEEDICKLTDSQINNDNNIDNNWIINPLTKRKVKIGSRTYKYLVENKFI